MCCHATIEVQLLFSSVLRLFLVQTMFSDGIASFEPALLAGKFLEFPW